MQGRSVMIKIVIAYILFKNTENNDDYSDTDDIDSDYRDLDDIRYI